MRNLVRILTALVCSMYLSFLPAQTDVTSVREKLNTQFNKTKDFSVDVQLSLKMTAIRMPQKKIRVFFKQPDHVKIETNGFAMVPQYGLPLSPETLFRAVSDMILVTEPTPEDGTVRLMGDLQIRDEDRQIWNFSRKQRRALSIEVTVNTRLWVIKGYEIFRGEDKLIHVQTRYTEPENGIYLPEETVILIKVPEELSDYQPDFPFEEGISPQDGKVTLTFKNYRLNQGLDESLFLEGPE